MSDIRGSGETGQAGERSPDRTRPNVGDRPARDILARHPELRRLAEELVAGIVSVVTAEVRAQMAQMGQGAQMAQRTQRQAETRLSRDRTATALSVNEAARRLGVSRQTLYRMISAGELRVAKIGSRTLVAVSELERVVEARTGRSSRSTRSVSEE